MRMLSSVIVLVCLTRAVTTFPNSVSEGSKISLRRKRHHEDAYNSDSEARQPDVVMSACDNASNHTFDECLLEKCISPDNILQYFNLSQDGIVSTDTFQPDLSTDILRLVKYYCFHQSVSPNHEAPSDGVKHLRHRKASPGEAWGYGIGFVLVINCISMVGAVLVPIMDKPFFKKTLIFMVALAVGAMAGTSIFVLIPEAFDLMNIEETAEKYKWKSTTIVASLFVFYVWEQAMRINGEWRKQKSRKKQKTKQMDAEEQDILTKEKEKPSLEVTFEPDDGGHDHGHSHGLKTEDGVATVAWVVLIADGIHKFVDGLSIGAAFSTSVVTGISVSVAILCEELPHELGDIAILVHSGMQMKKALLYNLLVSLPCIVGFIVGLLLSEAVSADQWIFAIAGGVFMYIALVDMLPEIRTADERDPQYKTISAKISLSILQNIGLLVGFLIIFTLMTVF